MPVMQTNVKFMVLREFFVENVWRVLKFVLLCIRFRLVKTTLSNERKSSLNNLHKDRDSSTRSDFNNVEIMG